MNPASPTQPEPKRSQLPDTPPTEAEWRENAERADDEKIVFNERTGDPAPLDTPQEQERSRLRRLIEDGCEAVAKGDATEAISRLIWANVEAALETTQSKLRSVEEALERVLEALDAYLRGDSHHEGLHGDAILDKAQREAKGILAGTEGGSGEAETQTGVHGPRAESSRPGQDSSPGRTDG